MSPQIETPPADPAAGRLPPELARQLAGLSRDSKEHLLALLREELHGPPPQPIPDGDPAAIRVAWKVEIARRIAAVRDGMMETYSIDEVHDHIRQALAEERGE